MAPRVFISYSWDSADHRVWVKAFASRLRCDGIDVVLDQWHAVPGERLPEFMERAVRASAFVLVICTPDYKLRSDSRTGGVGYEGDVMTGEVLTKGNHGKFIPLLRGGGWEDATPTWLAGTYGIDMTGDAMSEDAYSDLLLTLRDDREKAPPLGVRRTPHGERPNHVAHRSLVEVKEEVGETFSVAIRVVTTGQRFDVVVPVDAPARTVAQEIARNIGLRPATMGEITIPFSLRLKSGRVLDDDMTLRENGVSDGEVLYVCLRACAAG